MIEIDLFNYLKINYINDLRLSDNIYSHYDCYSKKFKCIIELKCRPIHYDNLILEKYKYDRLINFNCNVRYICSTPKGIFSFNIKTINPVWQEMNLPKSTEFINKEKVLKNITYLPINLAINLNEFNL